MKKPWHYLWGTPAVDGTLEAAPRIGGLPGWLIPATLGVVALVAATSLAFAVASSVPALSVSVVSGSVEVAPTTPLEITIPKVGGTLADLSLKETIRGLDGSLVSERSVPVKPIPVDEGLGLQTKYAVETADGSPLLAYDGQYELSITVETSVLQFPFPVERDQVSKFSFTTLTTPKVYVPQGVVEQKWQKPIEFRWSGQVKSFTVVAEPELNVKRWIDPARPEVALIDLTGARPGAQYTLRILDAVGANGAPLLAPVEFRAETAAPPVLQAGKVRLEDGYKVVIPWDRKIRDFGYEVTPSVGARVEVDTADPKLSYLVLENPRQGQQYSIKIKDAFAVTDAPMSGTRDLKVSTPTPLQVKEFGPEQPKFGVPLRAVIGIAFNKPVRDRAAAEASIKIAPSVPGRFEWKSDELVRFIPSGDLPEQADFSVEVAGTRSGVRAADGGYLDETARYEFWTALSKLIEVDLSQQKLVLWEGGSPILSTLVATGVRGAETPTGRFVVEYKMAKTRMRGTNPSGKTYDLPDVPWVLPFLGDYAIHGAYWREYYGTPQSNGCVSMPVSAAKRVYDWSPEGTAVRIH